MIQRRQLQRIWFRTQTVDTFSFTQQLPSGTESGARCLKTEVLEQVRDPVSSVWDLHHAHDSRMAQATEIQKLRRKTALRCERMKHLAMHRCASSCRAISADCNRD